MPVRKSYLSIRYRMLIIFSALYTLSFIVGTVLTYNFLTRLAEDMTQNGQSLGLISLSQAQQIVATLQARLEVVVLPAYIVSFVVLFGVVYLVSLRISSPMRALTRFAERVAEGDYTPATLPVSHFTRDEVTLLGDVLSDMVNKVRVREESLKQQIVTLQVKVDEVKRTQEVNDIVESEFFSKLKEQAKDLRARGGTAAPPQATDVTP